MNSKPHTQHPPCCTASDARVRSWLGAEDPRLISTDSCPTLVKYYKFVFTKTGLLKFKTGLRCLNILLELCFLPCCCFIPCEHTCTSQGRWEVKNHLWAARHKFSHGVGGRPGTWHILTTKVQKEPLQQQCQGLCWPPQHKTDAQHECASLKLIAQQEKIL